MTDNDAPRSNWGERRAERRNRRRWAISGAAIVVSVCLGLAGQYNVTVGRYIAPAGYAADAGAVVWAALFLAAMAGFALLVWREIDEVKRRAAVNAAAVAGLTSIVLLLLAQAAGTMLPVTRPLFAVMLTTMLSMLAALLFQRIRG